MLELKGLRDNHPGAITAAFGLLAVFPKTRLSFKEERKNGGYHACLHDSPFATIQELAAALSDKKTWEEIIPLKEIEEAFSNSKKEESKKKQSEEDDDEKKSSKMPLSKFTQLAKNNHDWASALATDHVISLVDGKEDAPVVSNNPSFPNLRSSYLYKYLDNWIYQSDHDEKSNYITSILSSPVWKYKKGLNFELFPEISLDAVHRQGPNEMEAVPILCLLSVVNWLNCPTYSCNGRVMSPLWRRVRNNIFLIAPVFTLPVSRFTMMSWFLNQDILQIKTNKLASFGIAKINQFWFKYHSTRKELRTLVMR